MSFHSLPTELLSQCFRYLEPSKADIRNLRLVSRRCNAISSPFLKSSAVLSITSGSLSRLQELSEHPVFSRSITLVDVDVSYYDSLMADDLALFAKHNESELFHTLECMERGAFGRGDKDFRIKLNNLFAIAKMWEDVAEPTFDKEKCNDKQKLLIDAHSEYIRLYNDQEKAKECGAHITTMITAFNKLLNLKSIKINDSQRRRGGLLRGLDMLSDEELFKRCLWRSQWKGSFRTALITSPPVEFVALFFTALAKTVIRPKFFDISITAPVDLRCLQYSETQLNAIRKSVSQAERLSCTLQSWARRGSLAENNDRPRDEMVILGTFIQAFLSSPTATEINLSLDDYPVFYEVPTVSISSLVQLSNLSTRLRKVYFRNIPFVPEDIRSFVNRVEGSLECLNGNGLYLLRGSWEEALDILRALEKLDYCELLYIQGCEFGDCMMSNPIREAMSNYVLKKTDKNPVIGFEPDQSL